ncbi:1656_t:CDS:1, partial [Gigaspora rosea]
FDRQKTSFIKGLALCELEEKNLEIGEKKDEELLAVINQFYS